MASEGKSKASNSSKGNKRRRQYLPHNRPVKKGSYPLRPGVEGFFITCDGGKEYQASLEAINVLDSFYEELTEGNNSNVEKTEKISNKPSNKVTKFTYSDSSSDEEDDSDNNDEDKNNNAVCPKKDSNAQKQEEKNGDNNAASGQTLTGDELDKQENKEKPDNQEVETAEPPLKKHCTEASQLDGATLPNKVENKSVDKLIEEELKELGDKSKRRFGKLDSGCNGVIFIQMRRKDGDPSPKDIIQHMMTSLAATKKHVARFLLRLLPVEVTCYTSDDEIERAIKPLIEKYFPVETETPRKFAVVYDARANTGIDRAKVIDAVAKSVPSIHKVDLTNPELNIIVQIVKTICVIGVVEKYKEFAKYNLRQLTSSNNH